MVTKLLKVNGDPNIKENNGCTPLHNASKEGHLDVVTKLLEVNGDPNIKQKDGWTPLHNAS